MKPTHPSLLAVSRRGVMGGLAMAGLAPAGLAAPHVAPASSREWSMIAMEHFPPCNYLNGGELVGIDIDILTEATRELGITMRILPLPWQRAILSFETGAADGLFQLTMTPRRIRHWHMTGPMRMTRLVFMVPAELRLADTGGLGGLSGQVVGTVNGFTYGAAFGEAGGFIREGSMDDETSLRKLLLGRASVILGGEANLTHVAVTLGVRDRVRILPTPLAEQPRYATFRRDPAIPQGAGKPRFWGRSCGR